MGLDQYLTVEISTNRKEYPIELAKKYLKNINSYLSNIGYSAEFNYWEEDENPNYTLDDLYDIDGYHTKTYSFANIKGVQQNLRKANQIQNYFESKFYENNSSESYDCINTVLNDVDIDIILSKIEKIMSQKTPEAKKKYAERILPTTVGFFYGDTDYDQYYFDNLTSFAEQLKYLTKVRNHIDQVMTDSPFSVEIVYSSWWWSYAKTLWTFHYGIHSLSSWATFRCYFV